MFIYNAITAFADWAWGIPMLVWLVGGGIILTVATGFIQIRKLGFCLKHTIVDSLRNKKSSEHITGMQAVLSALSGTIGTGNIVGVGAAIALGGPGAVFWMWVVGIVAMGIKYCEALSSVKYRDPAAGTGGYLWNAGPTVYLKKGVPFKTLGMILGTVYGFTVTWGLLLSAPEHTSAITDIMTTAFGIDKTISIAVCVVIVGTVMLGGMKRFVKVSEVVVPVMSVIYIVFGLLIVILNIGHIPGVLGSIFTNAFTGTAAVGGFAGAGIAQAIRWGTARGMYSSDAGTGIQSIMHGQADVEHPVQQGMWGVFEVFVDTIIICTFTALVILSTGVWETGADGSTLALMAFSETFGMLGTVILSVSLFFFAITSAVGMAVFMERHCTNFFNKTVAKGLDVVYICLMIAGGWVGFDAVLPITDMSTALNIFINMTGLVLMAGGIRATTKDYFENYLNKEKLHD